MGSKCNNVNPMGLFLLTNTINKYYGGEKSNYSCYLDVDIQAAERSLGKGKGNQLQRKVSDCVAQAMSHPSSEDETDVSESELEEYVDRCYEQLKADAQKVIFSDELYRCPYCPGKKKLVHPFKDILQHASDVGKGSQNNSDIKRKAKHMGLVRFMNNDVSLSSDFSRLAIEAQPSNAATNDIFVWPWMGILANVNSQGICISNVKNDLVRKGIRPVRIRALSRCAEGYAVVEFERTWSGFYRAVMFEKSFEAENRGKKDYRNDVPCEDDGVSAIYGWVAREDDYNAKGDLGEYLRRNGDLKTVDDVEAEEKRRNGLLVADLTKTIEDLRNRPD